jgi:hypothetical protein
MKPCPQIGTLLLLLTAFCGAVNAQVVTEYGSMASKSATVGKRAASISNNIGGVWGSLDKTVRGAPDQLTSQPAPPARVSRQRAPVKLKRRSPAVAAVHEDPTRIQAGIGYSELMSRFGRGSYEVATGPATKTVVYPGKNGDIHVDLLDEKVSRVILPQPQQVAAVATK